MKMLYAAIAVQPVGTVGTVTRRRQKSAFVSETSTASCPFTLAWYAARCPFLELNDLEIGACRASQLGGELYNSNPIGRELDRLMDGRTGLDAAKRATRRNLELDDSR
ncbi:hypothetical protein HRbin27_02036 [bacterium HR27]|nr:hypothetical protein HRbin27_02036 [bacterium HR27]